MAIAYSQSTKGESKLKHTFSTHDKWWVKDGSKGKFICLKGMRQL